MTNELDDQSVLPCLKTCIYIFVGKYYISLDILTLLT